MNPAKSLSGFCVFMLLQFSFFQVHSGSVLRNHTKSVRTKSRLRSYKENLQPNQVNATIEPSRNTELDIAPSTKHTACFKISCLTLEYLEKRLDHLKIRLLNYYDKKSESLITRRDGHGGIGFPSLEGALLSLAFLTFAVFLIDLIQQLLSRLRTGTAVQTVGRRRKRGALRDRDIDTTTVISSIVSSIENPRFAELQSALSRVVREIM